MKTFTDATGRNWMVELNVHQMKRIRATLQIDLVNVVSIGTDGDVRADLIDRIASDPCLLVDILWVLCEDEAKKAGVTDTQFGRSLAGDSIEQATRAFLDELIDFFPGAKRLFLRKAIDLARKMSAETEKALAAALESPEFEKRAAESMNLSTKSPESSE